jgi:hypothetical protein
MHLEEAKDLQAEATQILENSLRTVTAYGDSGNLDSDRPLFPPGIGIHPTKEGKYKLAIRLVDRKSGSKLIEPLLRKFPIEKIDLQITGPVRSFKQNLTMVPVFHERSWIEGNRDRGTIGCLVRKPGNSDMFILSNQHVFAHSNNARENDPIIAFPRKSNWIEKIKSFLPFFSSEEYKEIAFLREYIRPENSRTNLVDAAIAHIRHPSIIEEYSIDKFGVFEGFHRKELFNERDDIYKLPLSKRGMKTGLTQGTITGFNISQVINYSGQPYEFVELLEIKSQGYRKFSKPGDSGSIIYDSSGYAVGLLLAGTPIGVTYAIPISTVLETLDIELIPRNDNQIRGLNFS